jgi:hypothetical protein
MDPGTLVTPWGIWAGGYPVIVWAGDERSAVRYALEWIDYVQHIGHAPDDEDRIEAEQLGSPRPWTELEPLWSTSESTAWGAARDRARRMRQLLGVKRWWLAISEIAD